MSNSIFSGIQPSGNLHIGNYIGAIQQWLNFQNNETTGQLNNDFIFCIVDLHAITVPQDPRILREKNREVAALYIACGIDPHKSHIFIQSENPDHSYLTWIFDCITPIGWMNRMTQFKDKSEKQKESTSVGLFNYPALMAADILLYDTDFVPVGEDQTQHIELTRDIAQKFNATYGTIFKEPKAMIDTSAARIMSLQNPSAKMSKSDKDPKGTINLLDTPDNIREKVKRAVTDSGSDIRFDKDKPAMSNLLTIYSKLSRQSISQIEERCNQQGYAAFKEDLAEVIIKALVPIQEKFKKLMDDKEYLDTILNNGRDFSLSRSRQKILQVKEAIGLGR